MALAVVVVAVALGLAVCAVDDDDGGGGSAPGTSAPSTGDGNTPLRRDAEEVAAALLGEGEEAPAVGRAEGSVETSAGARPAIAEVVAVEVEDAAILLRWRLRSTGETLVLRATTFSSFGQPSRSATEVALVDPAGQELARPFRTRGTSFGISCICSFVPNEVDGTGQELTGLYPRFSRDVREVEVRIPGFPPITGVPVVRR